MIKLYLTLSLSNQNVLLVAQYFSANTIPHRKPDPRFFLETWCSPESPGRFDFESRGGRCEQQEIDEELEEVYLCDEKMIFLFDI